MIRSIRARCVCLGGGGEYAGWYFRVYVRVRLLRRGSSARGWGGGGGWGVEGQGFVSSADAKNRVDEVDGVWDWAL